MGNTWTRELQNMLLPFLIAVGVLLLEGSAHAATKRGIVNLDTAPAVLLRPIQAPGRFVDGSSTFVMLAVTIVTKESETAVLICEKWRHINDSLIAGFYSKPPLLKGAASLASPKQIQAQVAELLQGLLDPDEIEAILVNIGSHDFRYKKGHLCSR